MTTATSHRAATRKPAKKVDITQLSNRQLEALDEETFLSSLSPWLRKLMIAAKPFKGKLG